MCYPKDQIRYRSQGPSPNLMIILRLKHLEVRIPHQKIEMTAYIHFSMNCSLYNSLRHFFFWTRTGLLFFHWWPFSGPLNVLHNVIIVYWFLPEMVKLVARMWSNNPPFLCYFRASETLLASTTTLPYALGLKSKWQSTAFHNQATCVSLIDQFTQVFYRQFKVISMN